MNSRCCAEIEDSYYIDDSKNSFCPVLIMDTTPLLQRKLKNLIEKKLHSLIATIYKNSYQLDFSILEDYKCTDVSFLYDKVSKHLWKNEIEACLLQMLYLCKYDEHKFQYDLEQLNEKTDKQKNNGVFYTPEDTVNYIISNAVELYNKKNVKDVIDIAFFDPTCGTGAFLLQVLDLKLKSVKSIENNIFKIIKTIFGNDKDDFSIFILKLRLIYKLYKFNVSLNAVWKDLGKQFFTYDFITEYFSVNKKFDIVVGNPPYVESNKSDVKDSCRYGNLYADVVNNSLCLLKSKGVLGYIIPLSYISTPRFSTLRQVIARNTSEEYISSFADRPDCLFTSVHQKLNILLAVKEKSKQHKIYTSDYCYWYKQERNDVFKKVKYIENPYSYDEFYTKIGNKTELKIFNKVINKEKKIEFNNTGDGRLFLNMRATFWIKAFTQEGNYSKEYKPLMMNAKDVCFLHILFSSSLFWWFWVKVSDCWHITLKDLKMFRLPEKYDSTIVNDLSMRLTNKLEDTKVYVNTKQTEYEYKHKDCKDIINLIDDYIGRLYGLNSSEINYLKSYNIKYRMGQKDEL